MVNEDAALLNRRVTHMTPAALFSRRLQIGFSILQICRAYGAGGKTA
jgi:hypothetical protein